MFQIFFKVLPWPGLVTVSTDLNFLNLKISFKYFLEISNKFLLQPALWQTYETAPKLAKREGENTQQQMELQPASMVANGLLGQYFVPVSAPSEDAHVHAQKTLPVTSVDYPPATALPNLQNSSIPAMNIVQAVSAHQPQSSNTYTPSIGKLHCKMFYFHRATPRHTLRVT